MNTMIVEPDEVSESARVEGWVRLCAHLVEDVVGLPVVPLVVVGQSSSVSSQCDEVPNDGPQAGAHDGGQVRP